jgi:diguanylate cyclase (GGDEF)-like protein
MALKKHIRSQGNLLVERLAESNARLLRRIVELEQEVADARHLAHHDALTGLPNRTLLLDRLAQATQQAQRQHKAVGLLLLDLDSFKGVNDQLGHHAGDQILKAVAERLAGCIRGCDTACRYGGDEFVILLPEIRGSEDLDAVAQKIRACLAKPHRLGDQAIVVDASFGSALFNEASASDADLIGAADLAMYRAKARSVVAADPTGEAHAAA